MTRPDTEDKRARIVQPSATHRMGRALGVLSQIEDLGTMATGALYAGRAPRCAILLDRGRVCWAAAEGAQRQLAELLVKESGAGFDRKDLELLVRQCLSGGRPLLQALLDERMVTAHGLRRALLKHTSQSIAAACRHDRLKVRWRAQASYHYDARYNFPTCELLDELAMLIHGSSAAQARAALQDVVPRGGIGVATLVGQRPNPIAFVASRQPRVSDLMASAEWARDMVELSRAVHPNATDLVVRGRREQDSKIVVWSDQRFIFAVTCPTQSSLGVVWSKRTRIMAATAKENAASPPFGAATAA